jgi:hypothetical protein
MTDQSRAGMHFTSSVSNAINFCRPCRSSTPDRANFSSRREVAGARFDIAFSCSHPLRSSLCSRANSCSSPAKWALVTEVFRRLSSRSAVRPRRPFRLVTECAQHLEGLQRTDDRH